MQKHAFALEVASSSGSATLVDLCNSPRSQKVLSRTERHVMADGFFDPISWSLSPPFIGRHAPRSATLYVASSGSDILFCPSAGWLVGRANECPKLRFLGLVEQINYRPLSSGLLPADFRH